jgi:maltokinase
VTDRQAQVADLVARVVTELPEWLPGQRWFAGKDRQVTAVRPVSSTSLLDGDPMLLHLVVEVVQGDRDEHYQLLIGCGTQLPDHLGSSWLGTEDGLLCYEAAGDADLTGKLLDLIVAGRRVGPLTFEHEPDVELTGDLRARPVLAEQSNTSLVFGSQYILKLYRKLAPGLNPDLMLHRALRGVGSEHIAPPLGSISGDFGGAEPTTVAMLQQFVGDAVDGWAMATTSVRDLMAEPTMAAAEVGGDFAGEAQRLGHAVATVHAELRAALGRHEADADEFERTSAAMTARLDAVAARVPELAPMAPALRSAFEKLREVKSPVFIQFIHGDLHLGQVLRTAHGWLLIDFEGEPGQPLDERRRPDSTLRDVAGVLRSFEYAAYQRLMEQASDSGAEDRDRQLAARAREWVDRNAASFCEGYAEVSGADPRDSRHLLEAYELDKAVYEAAYEARHRPTWLPIPMKSIARIVT